MKKIKLTKESIALLFITILSAVLNFGNLAIEGTANAYYAAAVKSMTMSLKNFFFVSFDPAGFVTIDKPPLGFWLQAISAKIFGYHGWSIILPQALAGVLSVIVLYQIVKRSFGKGAGLISALCLAVTPGFVAASRNNTIDNVLVLVLLLACWALSVAAEKGRFKYLLLSMAFVGLGFNVKMLQAYMVVPALYITYLLTTATSFRKRIVHLVAGTLVLLTVSLSWALVVDSVPASSRPYVDSSTNNTVMELIFGHNGIERLSLGSNQSSMGGGRGGDGQAPQFSKNADSSSGVQNDSNQGFQGNPPANGNGPGMDGNTQSSASGNTQNGTDGNMQGGPDGGMRGQDGNMHDGFGKGMQGGGSWGLQGSFGGQVKSGITRLFTKNILSDQIVWFIPLAIFGFIAAAIREKLRFRLDNKRKQSLVLWFMWFLPVFIYFSYNTGLFHPHYLTMLAPPAAALAGIGITVMWEFYREGGWKSWFLPAALITNGAVQLLMLSYFESTSNIVKVLMVLLIILCFGASVVLAGMNLLGRRAKKPQDTENMENTDTQETQETQENSGIVGNAQYANVGNPENLVNRQDRMLRFKKILAGLAVAGLLITPLTGSAAAMFTGVGSTNPVAGLELLSSVQSKTQINMSSRDSSNSGLINFLLKNKTSSQKYLLVVSNSNSASDIIIKTGEPVMAIGGFMGSDKSITLDQFKELVRKGEVRYVMTGGQGGNGGEGTASEIMSWVQQNGTAVSSSEYSNASSTQGLTASVNQTASGSQTGSDNQTASGSQTVSNSDSNRDGFNRGGFGGGSGQLYDLKPYTDSLSSK